MPRRAGKSGYAFVQSLDMVCVNPRNDILNFYSHLVMLDREKGSKSRVQLKPGEHIVNIGSPGYASTQLLIYGLQSLGPAQSHRMSTVCNKQGEFCQHLSFVSIW